MIHQIQDFCSRFSHSIVETIDIFGQLPNFRVLEKGKYTTSVGCFLTFFIGVATLSYLINEFVQLLSKSEPNVVSAEVQIFDSTSFPLYNENFTLAVTIANKHSEPILGQLKYYNLTVSHCIRERLIDNTTGKVIVNLNCLQLPIAPCTRADFDTDLQMDFFQNTRLGVVQCIDRERLRTNPPVLQGIISGSKYQYMVIQLSVCKNNTEYHGCAPVEEIQQILSAGHYSVYASDYLMQLDRGNIPFQEFINLDINSFSISTSKMLQWTYRISEVHTDDGLFFRNDIVSLNLKKQDRREQTELYNDDYLVYHYIQLDYKEQIYKRSYIKVQAILSKIGGLWQLFMLVSATLLSPLISNLMTISIANELYRFPKNQQLNQRVQIFDLQQSDQVIDFMQKQSEPLSEEEERLSGGLLQSLLIVFGCDKRKNKIFTQVKQEILKKVDIVKIIEKLQEVEMLKLILLNEEQYKLFDLLPKPNITEIKRPMPDDSDNNNLLSDIGLQSSFRVINKNKRIQSNRLKEYFHSFSQVSQYKRRNSVDEKLLQLIDRNIIQFFQQIQLSQHRQSNCNLSPVDPCRSKIDQSITEPNIQRPR